MGCLARLGCLILLAILLVAAWFTRDLWLPVRYRSAAHAPVAVAPAWEPLSAAGAARTQAALAALSKPTGQVFQTLSGADVASYVFSELAKQLPPSTDSLRVMATGDELALRASIRLADIGGAGALGPLAAMLGDREPVQVRGTLRVVKPGLAEFEVRSLEIRQIAVPAAMIPRLIARLDRAPRPAGVDANAVPLPIPSYIGDIRVANGKITLYKTTS